MPLKKAIIKAVEVGKTDARSMVPFVEEAVGKSVSLLTMSYALKSLSDEGAIHLVSRGVYGLSAFP